MAELTTGDVRSIISQANAATGGSAATGFGQYKQQTLVMNTQQIPVAHMAEEIGIAYQGRLASALLEKRSNKRVNDQVPLNVTRTSDMDEEMSMSLSQQKVTKKEEVEGIDHSFRNESEQSVFEMDLKLLMDSMSDLEESKLEQFYQDLMGTNALTDQSLRQMVKQRFSDPSFQYVATLFCLNKAESELKMLKESPNVDLQWLGKLGQLVKLLRKEARWYEDNYSRQIQASINISKVVKALVAREKGLLGQDLHQFYKDAVLDYSDLKSLYGMVLKRYSIDRFKFAIDFLMKSLIADYDAQGPSIVKDKLKAIMDDIYQLHVLESVHLQCKDLHGQLSRTLEPLPYSVEFMLEHLLAYQASEQPGLLAVSKYLDNLLFLDKALWARIVLLNGTKKIIRLVPLKMFRDKKNRENSLSSIQSMLDDYSDEEDDESSHS